jgi:hypothetical protein
MSAVFTVWGVFNGSDMVATFSTEEKAVLFANDEPYFHVQDIEVE